MNEAPRYVTLRDYVRVAREQRKLIAAVTLVFAVGALLVSAGQPAVYLAEASLQFQDVSQESSLLGTQVQPIQAPQTLAAVSAQSVTTPRVARRVKRVLKSPLTVEQLQQRVTAQVEAQTDLVVIQARESDASRAARLANAFAREARNVANLDARRQLTQAAESVRRASKKLSGAAGPGSLTALLALDRIARLQSLARFATPATFARVAERPDGPISPQPIRNGLLGAILGVTLGILAAFIRDSLDRRLRSAREIQEHAGMPLLGAVRNEAMGLAGPINNGRGPMSDADLESFRILRTNLEFLDVDHPLKSVVITSALPEEGKSTVAASLAFASVASGKQTILVEGDLRRPALAERLGIAAAPGLSEYLLGRASPAEILQTVELPGTSRNGSAEKEAGEPDDETPAFQPPNQGTLVCITAGQAPPHATELLGSKRFQDFLVEVTDAYDAVIIDGTPLLAVVDTLELLPHVDGVVVCVRASRTTRDQVRAAKSALEHLPERPMGLVVTGIRAGDEADYGYYYSYAYRGS